MPLHSHNFVYCLRKRSQKTEVTPAEINQHLRRMRKRVALPGVTGCTSGLHCLFASRIGSRAQEWDETLPDWVLRQESAVFWPGEKLIRLFAKGEYGHANDWFREEFTLGSCCWQGMSVYNQWDVHNTLTLSMWSAGNLLIIRKENTPAFGLNRVV